MRSDFVSLIPCVHLNDLGGKKSNTEAYSFIHLLFRPLNFPLWASDVLSYICYDKLSESVEKC
jgi:hypothetical protein